MIGMKMPLLRCRGSKQNAVFDLEHGKPDDATQLACATRALSTGTEWPMQHQAVDRRAQIRSTSTPTSKRATIITGHPITAGRSHAMRDPADATSRHKRQTAGRGWGEGSDDMIKPSPQHSERFGPLHPALGKRRPRPKIGAPEHWRGNC